MVSKAKLVLSDKQTMTQQHTHNSLIGAKEKGCPQFPGKKGGADDSRGGNGEKAAIPEHLFDPSLNDFIP